MADQETLLANQEGTIATDGPLVLVCDCPGGLLASLVTLYAPVALLASIIVSLIVGLRAAPLPILLIAVMWTAASAVANALGKRDLRRHGKIRVDLERGEVVQQGQGFSRRFSLQDIEQVATPVAAGIEGEAGEPGFEPRWLVLEMKSGDVLRLGRGPAHALRPAVAFLRKAGLPVKGR